MRKTFLLLCAVAMILVANCNGKLSIEEKLQLLALEEFVHNHVTDPDYKPDSNARETIPELGDKAVSPLMEVVGQAAAPDKKVKKSDYWIIVFLTRIGTPKATDGIIKILEHDYEGAIAEDRQVAARALVALGAKGATSTLRKVIEKHKAWAEQQLQNSGSTWESPEGQNYKQQLDNLSGLLEKLKSGEGKIDHRRFS